MLRKWDTEGTLSYQLPKTSEVRFSVFNILGAEVKTLINHKQEAGTYSIVFNMDNYASGVYYYRIEAGKFVQSKKMVIAK